MAILIEGLEMPKGKDELLEIQIYPDGLVCYSFDLKCKQIAIATDPKQGRWIEVSDGSGYVGEPCEACSVCGMQTDYPSKYCPNCGARMDE